MIVGQEILDRNLIIGGSSSNLKNSTYDLTVGTIVPIGKEAVFRRRKSPDLKTYYLEPREMVWILSAEEFQMPNDVTGLATLRTAFTKQGILAINVGIIDPLFKGPISTALINFSDRPRQINVGEKFFRVAFFSHADVEKYHRKDESVARAEYLRQLEAVSYNDFSKSFLNIPDFDDEYYKKKFWSVIYYGITKKPSVSIPLILFFLLLIWYSFETGFWVFLETKFEWVKSLIAKIKPL